MLNIIGNNINSNINNEMVLSAFKCDKNTKYNSPLPCVYWWECKLEISRNNEAICMNSIKFALTN